MLVPVAVPRGERRVLAEFGADSLVPVDATFVAMTPCIDALLALPLPLDATLSRLFVALIAVGDLDPLPPGDEVEEEEEKNTGCPRRITLAGLGIVGLPAVEAACAESSATDGREGDAVIPIPKDIGGWRESVLGVGRKEGRVPCVPAYLSAIGVEVERECVIVSLFNITGAARTGAED